MSNRSKKTVPLTASLDDHDYMQPLRPLPTYVTHRFPRR